ncbi:hypothetical protein B9Z55_018430 [Caenorhabditis nigoni]|uniref:Uncharacterized protein n=1 Tax=Caenorhabditis nigoni TaxID=1611254 RepID=A0A2G5TE73_9PELO|nr:hypothetical protein B9Z55_018430 [Caenorhabditis nigoni]
MTQIYGSFDFVGSYRKWSKGRKGYTKTEHKYKDPTQGSSNYVSMTLGLSPTRKPSLFGGRPKTRICENQPPIFSKVHSSLFRSFRYFYPLLHY